MAAKHKGLLESINIRFTKEQGESFKKSVDASKSILDAIGVSISGGDGK